MKATSFLSSLPILSFLPYQALGYTWPSWTDELEDIMYLQAGMFRRGFHDGVSPCSFSPSRSPSRNGAAEWLRTAFHDAITHDKSTGLGGLDASLRFELDREENRGNEELNSTFGFFSGYQTIRSSMADLLALGVYTSVRECGGPVIPFRAGRIDATTVNEKGVPEPTTDLETTKEQFAKAGFNDADMIAMVACGHTLGGVHANNFPEITNSSQAPFDSSEAKFDNAVATEYFTGNTTNPLVVGPHATNSDMRIFSESSIRPFCENRCSDNNATMRTLTDPDTFKSTCASILQRMIDTVPSSVTLTDPILPVDIKPTSVKLSVTNATHLRFEGYIRVRMTERQKQGPTPAQVTLPYKDTNGSECPGCVITANSATFQGGSGSGFDDWFQFYQFGVDLPHQTAISSFKVEFNNESHDNGGNGFPIRSEILDQPALSCAIFNTQVDLTIVAAVRNDRVNLPTYINLEEKESAEGVSGAARISSRKIDMQSTGKVLGDYTFFSVKATVDSRFIHYDLVNGDVTIEFQNAAIFSTDACVSFYRF
ncbi:heme peroxidase [Marasmius fiardii PR-910]|nr:heme peroxidase [Marasmius fiardii PR-910]